MNQLAERNAELQRKVEALEAENCIQDFIISVVKELMRESDGVAGWHLNGDIASWDEVLPEINHSETPVTDASLAEIRAQGVDMFSDELGKAYQQLRKGSPQAKVLKSVVFRAVHFVQQLRKKTG